MRNTTVTVQRPEGTTIATGLGVQVDQMTLEEVLKHRQLQDYRGVDHYKLYTLWWPVFVDSSGNQSQIRRQDVLLDERFTNPETGAQFKYRVVGLPKSFDLDHQEMVCEVPVGA